MQLGYKIRSLRLSRGINQKQLAKAAHISQATISRIEQGKIHELKSSALARLAAALGVQVDSLIDQPYSTSNNPGYMLREVPDTYISANRSDITDHTPASDQINYLLQQAVNNLVTRKSFQRRLAKLMLKEIEDSLKERS